MTASVYPQSCILHIIISKRILFIHREDIPNTSIHPLSVAGIWLSLPFKRWIGLGIFKHAELSSHHKKASAPPRLCPATPSFLRKQSSWQLKNRFSTPKTPQKCESFKCKPHHHIHHADNYVHLNDITRHAWNSREEMSDSHRRKEL